ncbi:integrase family protein [Solidesulfovibrio carbinoliphilus subsp. oakridgensis]|uniref:Integrase family protein n=1 Tax=Solidesulfovibrio carbinoliphilus subsp. oakridgensis TaxID=694327 RepID=G7QBK1_9BACT|nr:site-specific integrase [Solidesulfovibrio carbinoliphilus]EHJ48864.1 integrase family protein [Solidesulfovibrio carbinoliphilus subsp. oakridgensis]
MATISDAWELYANLVLSSSPAYCIRTETGRWNNHIVKYFGSTHLVENITNKNLLSFRAALVKKRLSPQTITHCLSLLRRVLHRAQQWDLLDAKLPNFDMPKFDNKRVRFLTKSEANTLLVELSLKSQLWHDISLLALHTGLRAGEIFSLRPSHFDQPNSALYIFETKSNRNRSIPLNATARHILKANCAGSTDFVFKEHDRQIKNVNRIFSTAVQTCQFNTPTQDRRQRVVFHTLRHTFASWLVQAGTPLIVVSQLLGHKSLQMTSRYAHLAPTQGATAVKALEQFVDYVNIGGPL